MTLLYIGKEPVFKTTIKGSEISVRFTDTPQPQVKDNIIEILTSCYEGRVQEQMKGAAERAME